MTITVHQRPLEQTRSSSKSCKWVAEAIVNGRVYAATSRMAPANDIARQLVADGVPDAALHIYTLGLKGALVWKSFYRAARCGYEESMTKPVHMVRWRDPAIERAQIAARTPMSNFDHYRARISGSLGHWCALLETRHQLRAHAPAS